MNKLAIIILTAILLIGCGKENQDVIVTMQEDTATNLSYIHRNDCTFCKERHKQHVKNLIRKLK